MAVDRLGEVLEVVRRCDEVSHGEKGTPSWHIVVDRLAAQDVEGRAIAVGAPPAPFVVVAAMGVALAGCVAPVVVVEADTGKRSELSSSSPPPRSEGPDLAGRVLAYPQVVMPPPVSSPYRVR